jgi:hypothetical protein
MRKDPVTLSDSQMEKVGCLTGLLGCFGMIFLSLLGSFGIASLIVVVTSALFHVTWALLPVFCGVIVITWVANLFRGK